MPELEVTRFSENAFFPLMGLILVLVGSPTLHGVLFSLLRAPGGENSPRNPERYHCQKQGEEAREGTWEGGAGERA